MGTRVEVHIHDYRRRKVQGAVVRLESQPPRSGAFTRLSYDETLDVYVAGDVAPSPYQLTVEAPGFARQAREILVGQEKSSETVILGEPGMPSYYRGKVQIPFEPRPGLIAVSLRPRRLREEGEEMQVERKAALLGLVPVPIGAPIMADGSRVFRYPAGVTEHQQSEIQGRLASDPLVRRAGPVVHLEEDSLTFMTSELVIKLRAGLKAEEARSLASRFGLEVVRELSLPEGGYLLKSRDRASYELLEKAARIQETGSVEFAEPNMVTTTLDLQVVPGDYLYPQQSHHPLCGLPAAWELLGGPKPAGAPPGTLTPRAYGSPDITIAIMDRGIQSEVRNAEVRAQHPDFDGNVSDGSYKVREFFDFNTKLRDNTPAAGQALNPHGVRCAGVASALASNASSNPQYMEGVAGAAPNCRLFALMKPESGDDLEWAEAFCWTAGFDVSGYPAAPTPGADVISCSFIRSSYSIETCIKEAFEKLTKEGRGGKGVVVVFAAGNSGENLQVRTHWALSSHVIAVGASLHLQNGVESWGGSNFGNGLDLCAPVPVVTTTNPGDPDPNALHGYPQAPLRAYVSLFGGTSSAAAMVSGVTALVLSMNPHLRWDEVRRILCDTAVHIDEGNTDPIGMWQDTDNDGVLDWSQWYGHGRVDAEAAVSAAGGTTVSPFDIARQWIELMPPWLHRLRRRLWGGERPKMGN
ncbi:MAG: S8 family serine peptidase [Candidatus Polarisedimenticolia bacterium]